jgi:hypothetical protein
MERILGFLLGRLKLTEEEMWNLEEMLDDYIDARIEKRLDQEFSRGDYATW